MNVLVVDTSTWIHYFAGHDLGKIDEALRDSRVYLSPVVAAELMSGKMSDKHRGQLTAFLDDLPICECPLSHWIRVGLLRSQLAAKGITISTPDAHIAQCALDLKGLLVSDDKIFAKVAAHSTLRLD